MRKLLLLLLVISVAAIALYRQRLFLRDPLGKVLVGGAAATDAKIFINYSNDVLILKADGSSVMVQGWDRMPGHPEQLSCLRELACVTGDDRARKTPLKGSGYNPATAMSDREVSYRDEAGETVRAILH